MKCFMKLCLIVLLFLTSAGCSMNTDSRSFIHPDADFSFYKKVGVVSFRNQATDSLAGEKVTEHFMTELLIKGKLDVMDPGQFNGVIAQVAGTRAPVSTLSFSPENLEQIAQVAGVEGIFMGVVHEYAMIQLGGEKYPLISMTLKFIDAPTGTVAWQNNVTSIGGPNFPIVSIGETFTLGQLTQKVCRNLAKDFFSKAYRD